MPNENKSVIRCAIYTRKSSEEGLEQSFNSLEAQREACVRHISPARRTKAGGGIATHYDDGGWFPAALMERPALRQLLADIDRAGKVDTVVVYKVDRLTRSLADFAKIIERFDAREVSFVSVTQQFNTTTSMGRLTLNVLLSFAQFEREVTGERIRDKIAASKRKGMWMGGTVPVGYDLRERKLFVNTDESAHVMKIFRLYLELGCVAKLKARLDRDGVQSKARISGSGKKSGGMTYSRGALYCLFCKTRFTSARFPTGMQHTRASMLRSFLRNYGTKFRTGSGPILKCVAMAVTQSPQAYWSVCFLMIRAIGLPPFMRTKTVSVTATTFLKPKSKTEQLSTRVRPGFQPRM